MDTTKELTKDEVKKLVELCKQAESLRMQLSNEDNHEAGIKQAVKLLNKNRDISYNKIRIESGYDTHSKNWFNVAYNWYDEDFRLKEYGSKGDSSIKPFWASEDYNYDGHIDSCSIGFIWLVIEKFGEV